MSSALQLMYHVSVLPFRDCRAGSRTWNCIFIEFKIVETLNIRHICMQQQTKRFFPKETIKWCNTAGIFPHLCGLGFCACRERDGGKRPMQ